MASISDDLSRLSVSEPYSASSRVINEGPIPVFGDCAGISSILYHAGIRGTSRDIHQHEVVFNGYSFTVDGGPVRDAKDPKNKEFVESIRNYGLPVEFSEDGHHRIRVVIGCGGRRENANIPKEYLDEFYRLMSISASSADGELDEDTMTWM